VQQLGWHEQAYWDPSFGCYYKYVKQSSTSAAKPRDYHPSNPQAQGLIAPSTGGSVKNLIQSPLYTPLDGYNTKNTLLLIIKRLLSVLRLEMGMRHPSKSTDWLWEMGNLARVLIFVNEVRMWAIEGAQRSVGGYRLYNLQNQANRNTMSSVLWVRVFSTPYTHSSFSFF
jgi:hypothetical protein